MSKFSLIELNKSSIKLQILMIINRITLTQRTTIRILTTFIIITINLILLPNNFINYLSFFRLLLNHRSFENIRNVLLIQSKLINTFDHLSIVLNRVLLK